MAENNKHPEGREVELLLPAAALPRLEKARAEAELCFNKGIRELSPDGHYDPQKRPEVEVLLFQYIHTLWATYAEEALNSASNTWVVRKHIEEYLSVVIGKAFREKHPTARLDNWKEELQRFGSLTITFIKIKSSIWNEVQTALIERAETELVGSTAKEQLNNGVPIVNTRMRATITSKIAARRMEAYLEAKNIGLTEFAIQAQTTDRTLRSFRKTGKVRRDIFDNIAKAMGTTRDALLKD